MSVEVQNKVIEWNCSASRSKVRKDKVVADMSGEGWLSAPYSLPPSLTS